jgi:GDP-D-mannose 3', 5'-epimerase
MMQVKGKSLLVCGAGGFVGGHLVKTLHANGASEIRAVDIKPLDDWYQKTPSAAFDSFKRRHLKNI